MSALAALLRPRSVAVIGASADPAKMTGRPIGYLQRHGFAGAIWPVNPRAESIAGLPCFADVAALPGAPDAAIVLLGPERAEAAVRDLAQRGCQAAIVLASGYGEASEEGARRQEALKLAAGPMRLLGPNTIGLVNLTDGIMLSATGALEVGDLPAGRISVVSQSGGILGSLLSRAADRGIGFAKLVSTGNEADLDSSDLLAELLEDPATDAVAVYMEGLRRPEAFRRAARRAAELGKPIVVYKVGRSESGARAASSHTGAMAGSDRVYDAMFRQLGVIRAESFTDLLDIPAALVTGRRMAGQRVAILTSTGGAGTLLADHCGLAGIEVPAPDAGTTARLATLLDEEQATVGRNPVDVTLAGLRPDLFRGAIGALLDSPAYDALVVVIGSSALAAPELAARAIVECQARSDKPVLAYVSPHAPHLVRLLNSRGIAAFATPESCAPMLRALQRRAVPPAPEAPSVDPGLLAGLPPGNLNEAESKSLFARFGVPVTREAVAADAASAATAARALGGEVVLKILSRAIPHKSELGGVRVGLTAEEVPAACAAMLDRLRAASAPAPEGFLVQERVRGGIEMILGFHRDAQLGPVLLVGAGGVAVELFQDTALRLLPITRADAEAMLEELQAVRLLRGWRGAPPADRTALVDAILGFATMVAAAGERLIEAEINPLLVLPEGQGVRAADGLAVLR
ncbi:acetate--CoA ligase family protein [Roseococcus sp. SDR]|uniref:acetate--CoA ligase family protein n=1 Tax=Roseococcus sp. SDR TaxID=2835532 RepID=UPI001BCB681E|nr:acetate--CoA ligase family protein [Roseococcus sp. SDR]MBS7791657.1 acetate--CoA ligase family protein [Roseococcus sp. SDR]MBV1846971.1 acetate--CoA ligase family protein [Roseococcus sp. SDR]